MCAHPIFHHERKVFNFSHSNFFGLNVHELFSDTHMYTPRAFILLKLAQKLRFAFASVTFSSLRKQIYRILFFNKPHPSPLKNASLSKLPQRRVFVVRYFFWAHSTRFWQNFSIKKKFRKISIFSAKLFCKHFY